MIRAVRRARPPTSPPSWAAPCSSATTWSALRASGAEEVAGRGDAGRLDVVVVDSALPGAAGDRGRRSAQDPTTRSTAIVALGRSEFGFDHLDLLEAGANAILPPAARPGLGRPADAPHPRAGAPATRFPVNLSLEGGLRDGDEPSPARAVNLSVHGLLLECRHPLRVGEDLRFVLRRCREGTAAIEGRAPWSARPLPPTASASS